MVRNHLAILYTSLQDGELLWSLDAFVDLQGGSQTMTRIATPARLAPPNKKGLTTILINLLNLSLGAVAVGGT